MVKIIHVVINPAAGQPQPILNQINDVCHPAGVEWSVSITQKSGDATRFARGAIADGAEVIGAYGGDGTVMEVAQAVKGGDVPLAILPGGTANLMSKELGIPQDLTEAAKIMIDRNSVVRNIDMGQAGDKEFMLRVSLGFGAEKVKIADRQMKDKWGILAYSVAGLKALDKVPVANYHITIDGAVYDFPGKSCLIDNAGNLGVEDATASKWIDVSDGLLDVLLVRDVSLSSLDAIADSILHLERKSEGFRHWQGREISITCDLVQPVVGDGEVWGETPVSVKVLPGVLPILTPAHAQKTRK